MKEYYRSHRKLALKAIFEDDPMKRDRYLKAAMRVSRKPEFWREVLPPRTLGGPNA